MRLILIAARKDLLRFLRDPIALILWFAVPFVVGGLLMLVLGGPSGPAPRARLWVADEDDSFVSRLLLNALNQDRLAKLIEVERIDRETGRARLDDGDGTGLLIIPDGFGDALLLDRNTQLTFLANPAQRILPGIIQELLEILAEGVFYLHRVFGSELGEIFLGPQEKGASLFSDPDMVRISLSINAAMRRLEQYLFPPVIDLQIEIEAAEPRNGVPIRVLFVPGLIMMGLLFAAQGVAEDLWRERTQRTLARASITPGGAAALLGGKLLAGTVMVGAISAAGLAAAIPFLGLSWFRFPLALVWSAASGLLLIALMLVIQVHASSQRAASMLSFSVLFPLFMLGGSLFPSEAMPAWMAAIGRWTPNGWAVEQLKAILIGRTAPTPHGLAFLVVTIVASLLLIVTAARVRRVFVRS